MTCVPPHLRLLLVAAVLSIACDKTPTGPKVLAHPAGTPSGRLAVTGSPSGIAVSPNGIAFVTLFDRNEIARFDVGTPTRLMSSIAIPVHPSHAAFSRDGNTALVASAGEGNDWVVYSVDVRSGKLTYARDMQNVPYRVAMAPDDSRFYVLMYGDLTQVYAYPLTGLLDRPQSYVIQVPGLSRAIAVSPTTGAVFVTTNYRVARLDPITLEIQAITGPVAVASEDVVVSADGSRVWFGSQTGTLVALDATSLEKVAEIATGDNIRGLALSPDGTQLWATALGDLLVIDPVRASIVTRVALGGTPGHVAFDRAGTTAFVTNEQGWVDVVR
jgi:DNA-binding beta-propeller fold protein YncE